MSISSVDELLKRTLNIIQGEDRLVKITLFRGECVPYDLSTVTEITAMFRKQDGGYLVKKLSLLEVSISNPAAGKIQISLSDIDTSELRVAKNQDFKIQIDIGAETRIVKFQDCLTVEKCA